MGLRLHQPDYKLMITVGVLVVFGLVMLASASSVISFEKYNDSNYLLKHQLLYGVLIGIVGLIATSKIDYHLWGKLAFVLLTFNILLLVAVLIPGVGFEINGAQRWINLGFTTLQPTELLKLTFILYLSTLFSKNISGIKDATYGLMPFLFMLGSIVILIMLQPDMGTMITIAVTAIVIYYVAGAAYKHLAWIFLGASSMVFLLIKMAPYRAARFTVFLNPALDPQGIGYHINQALLAIGSGGFFGLGLGHSRQKFLYLPEVTGDSIFAVISEELGFFFAIILVGLFLYLMIRGLKIAKKAPDLLGKLISVGIVSWIVIQAFVNIAAMVTLVPLTGIPLPFISYGSSALATTLIAIGILINISKQTKS